MEESTEIRVPIDKIVVHERFHNYQNDIGNVTNLNLQSLA